MDLYLIRHAHALDLGEQGTTRDEDRPLSERGEKQAEALALMLHKRGIAFDRLFASPLVRAQRTAELLQHAELKRETCDLLAPDVKPRKLAKFLAEQEGKALALVGHMPDLAHFAAWLIGDKKAQIDFAKAGVAYLTIDDTPGKGSAVLQWLVTPAWFE